MTGARIRVLAAAFAPVPGSGAASAAMLSMLDALRADLDLVTLKTEELSHIKRIGEARMFRVPVGTAHQRETYARAVGRQIAAEPYQVVHVFDPWAGAAAADLKDRGFSLVYEVLTFPDDRASERRAWESAHARTLSAADLVVVSSVAAATALEAQGIGDRVEVVRPAVDIGIFDWSESPRVGTPRLLYLGAFTRDRDLDTFLDAIGRIGALRPIRVLLAGESDADRRGEMRERVRALDLSDSVEIRGEPDVRGMPSIIAGADVCVATASGRLIGGLAEIPGPLLEHLACYRPIVAADVPGVSELVRDDVEGLLYPPGDSGALADAVLELLRDAVLRERVTEAGYRRARDELATGVRRRRVRLLYESLVPDSQHLDPWREQFEEVTGLIELSTTTLARLSEEGEIATPARPQRPLGEEPTAMSSDTHPALVLPDTDPGRR
jgi:glycosyltransferase involved in cell wall biosynthesis